MSVYGVGCDGLMKIFLQPLSSAAGYEPFASMARALAGDSEQVAATVIESAIEELPIGATMVTVGGETAFSDVANEFAEPISVMTAATLLARCSASQGIVTAAGKATLLFSLLQPPPAILVLGAGLDAEPVVRFASELGWRVTIQDHRTVKVKISSSLRPPESVAVTVRL